MKPKDKNTGKPAGDYPDGQFYFRDDWMFVRNWTWSNQLNWVSAQDRTPSDTRNKLKSYFTVDVILRRAVLLKDFMVAASIRNLFDADVREPSSGPGASSASAAIPADLPQAGRNYFLEVSYHF